MLMIVLGKDLETEKLVAIKDILRQSGLYILGTQGQGKSKLIGNLVYQDLQKPYAVILFDPHEDLINHLLAQMPEELLEKTFLLDITDADYPFGLNIFDFSASTSEIDRAMAVDRVMHIFEKVWPEIKGVLLEKLLRYITLTFSEAPGHTLADIPRLLWDDAFRTRLVSRLTNEEVKAYWQREYNAMSAGEKRGETQALSNRLVAFLGVPIIKNIVCQRKTTINFQQVIQQHEILFVSLPKRMKDAAALIGTILLAQLYETTFGFGALAWNQRPGYALYVDEFQNFDTGDFAELIQEGRKFGARVAVAHQSRRNLIPANRAATLTASTIVAFQLTPEDAAELAPLFLDSTVTLRPEHIYPDVLRRLRLHEHQEIQEFYRKYVLSMQKLDEAGEDTRELLELLQDLLYQAVQTRVINEDLLQAYTLGMFPSLDLTFDASREKQAAIQIRLRQLEQTIAQLSAFLLDERAFESYLVAYFNYYSGGITYPHTAEWYYHPFVPGAFVLSDTRFWSYVLGKQPHPNQLHLPVDFKRVIDFFEKQAAENDALQRRDTPEKLLAEEKARIWTRRVQVAQQCWQALADLHKLKSTHSVYPAIRQFHEQAYRACLKEPLEQRGDPCFVQPVGSTHKRVAVDHATRVDELLIKPLAFDEATGREQLLAWLPMTSTTLFDMRQVHYQIQTAWARAIRGYADLQQLTRLYVDETAILVGYYAEVGKGQGRMHQDLWKEINDENVDRNVWEALDKEADRNAYLSQEMNTVEKFIELRKNELREKIAQLTEEYQAYQPTIPELEKQVAEEIAATEEQRTAFVQYVRHIIEILIRDPGSLGEKRVRKESDIKELLLNLPKRQAFVRVGGEIDRQPRKYIMQTLDARQAVKQDEAKQRRSRVREQTRSKYCRPRAEVEADFHARSTNQQDEHHDDEPPESWYEE